MKILFAIFTFIIFLNATNANLSELPEDFLQTFNKYKKFTIEKNSSELYKMELPYFRYLNSIDTYKQYINAQADIESMKISNIFEKNAKKLTIVVGLKLKNTKNMIYFKQFWFKLKNRYYILTKDEMFFNY